MHFIEPVASLVCVSSSLYYNSMFMQLLRILIIELSIPQNQADVVKFSFIHIKHYLFNSYHPTTSDLSALSIHKVVIVNTNITNH